MIRWWICGGQANIVCSPRDHINFKSLSDAEWKARIKMRERISLTSSAWASMCRIKRNASVLNCCCLFVVGMLLFSIYIFSSDWPQQQSCLAFFVLVLILSSLFFSVFGTILLRLQNRRGKRRQRRDIWLDANTGWFMGEKWAIIFSRSRSSDGVSCELVCSRALIT